MANKLSSKPLRKAGANAPQTQSLRAWLTQPRRANLRIGGCGHLLLTTSERARARARLVGEVLPRVAAMQPARISLFVGLAPGADMLLLKATTEWFTAQGIACDVTALLPVPVTHLVRDWVLRAQDGGYRISAAARARMQADADALLARCDTIVPLYPDDISDETLASRAFRQRQYRHLAALMAQHADLVVAILRADAQSEPGGTAEILAWRENPASIPVELRLKRAHCASKPAAMIIDPRAPARRALPASDDPLQVALHDAELARRSGNELLCLDLVNRALDRGLRSRRLDYLRIQALTNTGNAMTALAAYRSLDLDDAELDEDWLALHGRLEKDLGLRSTRNAAHHFGRAASAYLAAYQRHGGYYSGINAASMLMLAGEVAASRRLARRVLAGLDLDGNADRQERYYRLVTAAEAALLLGQPAQCRAQLQRASRLLPDELTPRSRTHRQLRRLCTQLQIDGSCVDALRLPPAVLLSGRSPGGLITAPLERLLARRALLHLALHGADELRLAEALLARRAHLYVTLPQPPAELLRAWRGSAQPELRRRLQTLLAGVEGSNVQRGFLPNERRWACAQADAMIRGVSQLNARRLGLRWQELAVSPGTGGGDEAAPHDATPKARHMVGLLFADFASFRRLDERMLPRYYRELMTPIAALINARGEHVLVRKTWGDALHLVTADAATAAQLAIEIQAYIEQRRLRRKDLLGDLELRIAAHYAPAYRGFDPIEAKKTSYGTQLLFTARIEPVAPPGMIYVTEAFAAQLALECGGAHALDYAGEIELAKRFGSYRLFALRQPV